MKTNREQNTEYDAKQEAKVRPSTKAYEFKPLEAVIRQWILGSK